ncbi:FAR-17a/AIG1-like protein [Mrakia frigida]|uniref:uncharacterized protein n=1 Tax=Mrakia frigida TaxID=29902 RepID=UPI003FCBEEB3
MSLVRSGIQVAAASYMYWGFHKLHTADFLSDIDNQYGGHWQFLTILGLWTSLLYLFISIFTPLLPSVLHPLKRIILLLALPVETVITSIYWSLILLAPQLILPPATPVEGEVQPEEPNLFRIPLSMDLALHAVPAVILLLEFFGWEKAYRGWRGSWGAAAVAAFAAVAYGTWSERCGARNNGLFPYPFLTFNTYETRLCIYGGATTFALFFFFGLNALKKKFERQVKGKGRQMDGNGRVGGGKGRK